jgi:hypothetical protein
MSQKSFGPGVNLIPEPGAKLAVVAVSSAVVVASGPGGTLDFSQRIIHKMYSHLRRREKRGVRGTKTAYLLVADFLGLIYDADRRPKKGNGNGPASGEDFL